MGIDLSDPIALQTLFGIRQQGAQTAAQIPTQLAGGLIQGAPNLALGFPQIGVSGLGQSAAIQQQGEGQALGFLSSIFGSAAQLGGSAAIASALCWVADELYGIGSFRAFLARFYVTTHDSWFIRLYRRHGLAWAHWLRRHPRCKPLVQPIWDRWARKSLQCLSIQ